MQIAGYVNTKVRIGIDDRQTLLTKLVAQQRFLMLLQDTRGMTHFGIEVYLSLEGPGVKSINVLLHHNAVSRQSYLLVQDAVISEEALLRR